jgi:hypothetical protein
MPTSEETADQVAKAQLALDNALAEHAAALDAGEANKPPEQIVLDLLEAIVMRLGNRPDHRALLKRLVIAAGKVHGGLQVDERDAAEMKFRAAIDQPPPTAS